MPDTFLASLRGKVFYFLTTIRLRLVVIRSPIWVLYYVRIPLIPLTPSLARTRMGIISYLLFVTWWVCPPRPFPRSLALDAQLGFLVPCLLSLHTLLVSLAFLLFLLLFLLLLCRLLLFFLLFLVLFLLLLFCLRRWPLLFLPFTLSLLLFLLLLLPFPFVHSSALSACSSCTSLPSLYAAWSSLSFGSFRGLLLFLFSIFFPFIRSSCFFLLLPFSSLVVCHFFPSSFWSCFCPSCHLFGLFGSYYLLVSPFACLVLCFFCSFHVGSGSFPGSSCVLYGLFCSFLFFFLFLLLHLSLCCRLLPLLCLRFLILQLTFRLVLAFLRRGGGGGGVVPHILYLSMFLAPWVPRLSSQILCTSGMARIPLTKALWSLILWGELPTHRHLVRSSPSLRVFSLLPNPLIPALWTGHLGFRLWSMLSV